MKKSPLATVKARFGEDRKAAKAELVKAVKASGEGFFVGEGDVLDRVSNAKLLRLDATFKAIKASFGSRGALVDGLLALEKRTDAGYKSHLEKQSTLKLWDRYRTLKRAA
jgi:hypothetical protein